MRKYQIKDRKSKNHYIRNVQPLGTNRQDFGYETSKPLGTNRPTRVRIVLGTKRPGYETSIIHCMDPIMGLMRQQSWLKLYVRITIVVSMQSGI